MDQITFSLVFFLPHHVSIRSVVELSVESIYLQNFVFYSLLL
jgi:hypothetical protein